jgi:hypothetical protein
MSGTPIDEDLLRKLIEKLEETHILEREILSAIRSIDQTSSPSPLTEDKKGNNKKTVVPRQQATTKAPAVSFQVGDRVRITNRVRLTAPFAGLLRPSTNGNDTGVIVRITKKRIHIQLTGVESIVLRDPANVELIGTNKKDQEKLKDY